MLNFKKIIIEQIEDIKFAISQMDGLIDFDLPRKYFSKTVKGKEYFYCQLGGTKRKQIYLGKENSNNMKKFVENQILIEKRNTLIKNLNLLNQIGGNYEELEGEYDGIFGQGNNILIAKSHLLKSANIQRSFEWALQTFDTNPIPIDKNSCICSDNRKVRSKGESIWCNMFIQYGIPFRYENKLLLLDEQGRSVEVYPDLSTLCYDGSLILVEHAGMLKEDAYGDKFKRKLKLYLLNGYVVGDNLILSSDNVKGGINTATINAMVKNVIRPRVFGPAFQPWI